MKKIAIAMVILLALGSFAFGETVVGGEFEFEFNLLDSRYNSDGNLDNWGDAEISIKSDVDDFNSVAIELDYESGQNAELYVDHAKLTTDVSGAMGLEGFNLTTTVGYFDTYFTNWNILTWNEMDWAPGYGFGGANDYGIKVEVGVEAGGVHFYAPASGDLMMIGADFAVAGANGFVFYDMDMQTETSVIGGDFGYGLEDLGLDFVTSFTYGLDSEAYKFGVAAAYGMGMLSTAAGFSYTDTEEMLVELDLIAAPAEGVELWAITNIDLTDGAADTVDTVELGGSYALGAATISVWADVMADDISPAVEFHIFF